MKSEAGSFRKHALTLFTGSLVGQAVPLLASPLLTRIYTPNEFGLFATFFAAYSAIAVIATGRYAQAIVIPKTTEAAANVATLAVIVTIAVSLLTALGVSAFSGAATLHLEIEHQTILWVIPIAVLLSGLYQTTNYWCLRDHGFREISLATASQGAATATGHIGLGSAGWGEMGLVAGSLLGQSTAIGILLRRRWNEILALRGVLTRRQLYRQARTFIDFPKINSLHALMDVLSSSGLFLMVGWLYGNQVLGLFAITIRVIERPLGLVSGSIAKVFYQRASEMQRDGVDMRSFAFRTVLMLSALSLPFLLVLVLWGGDLFAFIFGEPWRVGGDYAVMLAPWLIVRFVYSPISQIPLLLGQLKAYFWVGFFYNAIFLLTFVGAKILGSSIAVTFQTMSLVAAAYLIIALFWLFSLLRNDAPPHAIP